MPESFGPLPSSERNPGSKTDRGPRRTPGRSEAPAARDDDTRTRRGARHRGEGGGDPRRRAGARWPSRRSVAGPVRGRGVVRDRLQAHRDRPPPALSVARAGWVVPRTRPSGGYQLAFNSVRSSQPRADPARPGGPGVRAGSLPVRLAEDPARSAHPDALYRSPVATTAGRFRRGRASDPVRTGGSVASGRTTAREPTAGAVSRVGQAHVDGRLLRSAA